MRRLFFFQNIPVITEVVSPVTGVVSMIGTASGSIVSTGNYFLRVNPGSGSDVLVYPPHDGTCVSVDVRESDYVTSGQVVGTIRR